jgi:peptide/nickel transport system permease protein
MAETFAGIARRAPRRGLRAPSQWAGELWIGVVILGVVFLAAVIVSIVPFHDPFAISDDAYAGPSGSHWLGTDNIGRDSFTRLALAGRTSLVISACATAIACLLGMLLGVIAGYVGGFVDHLVMRVCDVMLAIPAILVALMVRVIVGPGTIPLIISMGLIYMPTFARVMRAPVLALRERDFVVAAEIAGTPRRVIMFSHLLPNALTPLFIQAAATASEVVLLEAALSYLGQGVQAPNPSAGRMISEFAKFMQTDPWLVILPAVLIVAISAAWNLIADGLQATLAPRRSAPSGNRRRRSALRPFVGDAVLSGAAVVADAPALPSADPEPQLIEKGTGQP